MAKGCSKRGKRQKIQRMNNGLIYSRPSLIISNTFLNLSLVFGFCSMYGLLENHRSFVSK